MILGFGLLAAIGAGMIAYQIDGPRGEGADVDPRAQKIYDATTGRLKLVIFDSNGDLKFDTWSYMDGDRLLRMDVDDDEDGTIDRREYFGPAGQLERIEYLAADGHVKRTEFYQDGAVVRTADAPAAEGSRER